MIIKSNLVSNLRCGDTVIFFPSYGHLTKDGRAWKVYVTGAVIEPEHVGIYNRMLLKLLHRVLKATPEELDGEIFRQRVQPFTASTRRGKRIAIRVGDRVYALQKKSKRNGHFRGTLRLDVDAVAELEAGGVIDDQCLQFDVVMPGKDGRVFSGRTHLLDETGTSIISDIDDTIKRTDVTSRRELLANTFLREFESVEGMAALYRQWHDQGAQFHYVSSSPWQLYDSLSNLLVEDGFPQGTVNLRVFRLRDHMIRKVLLIRRQKKMGVIKKLVATFPQRKFVLVGDSGERDPNLYGTIGRRFADRVTAILIRELPDNPMTKARCRKVFRNVSPGKWQIFSHSTDLPSELPTNGVGLAALT